MCEDLKENDPKNPYRLAKTRKRRSQDTNRMVFLKDGEGKIPCEDNDIKCKWRDYFYKLLNNKKRRRELQRTDSVEGPVRQISES